MPSIFTTRSGQYPLSSVAYASQVQSRQPSTALRAELVTGIKTAVTEAMEKNFLSFSKYQIAPEVFAAFTSSSLIADNIGIPDLAKPLVSGYLASIIFVAAAQITNFATGKCSRQALAKSLEQAIAKAHSNAIAKINTHTSAEAAEQGIALTHEEMESIRQAVLPKLNAKQLASAVLIGGTIFATTGYAATFMAGETAAGVAATNIVKSSSLMCIRAACGAFLADLNEKLVGLPQQSKIIHAHAFASLSLADLINATLLQGIPNSVKMAVSGLTLGSSFIPLLKFQQSINRAYANIAQYIQAPRSTSFAQALRISYTPIIDERASSSILAQTLHSQSLASSQAQLLNSSSINIIDETLTPSTSHIPQELNVQEPHAIAFY